MGPLSYKKALSRVFFNPLSYPKFSTICNFAQERPQLDILTLIWIKMDYFFKIRIKKCSFW